MSGKYHTLWILWGDILFVKKTKKESFFDTPGEWPELMMYVGDITWKGRPYNVSANGLVWRINILRLITTIMSTRQNQVVDHLADI